MADNKRPIKYQLTEEGYTLANNIAPSANIKQHTREPSSGGSLWNGRHSYGHGGGAHASGSGAGARDAGPVAGQFSNDRTRQATPVDNDDDDDADFCEQMRQAIELSKRESQSSGGGSSNRASTGHLRQAISLPKPLPSAPRDGHTSSGASSCSATRPSGSHLDGRKAASGLYAAHAAPAPTVAPAGNVGTARLLCIIIKLSTDVSDV